MKLRFAKSFKGAFETLSKQNKEAAERTLEKLAAEKIPPSIKLRRYKRKSGLWVANVNNKYRIVARKEQENTLVILDIDSHDELYKRSNRR